MSSTNFADRIYPSPSLAQISAGKRSTKDAVAIFILAGIAWYFSETLGLFQVIVTFQSMYGDWGLDDLVIVCVILSAALTAYTLRRRQDLTREIHARRAAEAAAVSSVRQLTRTKGFLDTILENVPATIFVRQLPQNRYILINREGEKFHGIPRAAILGRSPAEILPAAAVRAIAHHDSTLLQSAGPIVFEECTLPTPDGRARTTVSTGVAVRDDEGKSQYIVNVIQDVTERKQAEARIEHLAHSDLLTDLPNRAAFNMCLQSTVERASAGGEAFAVLCIDLDRFKEVNDVFGHAVGDGLLCEIAKRLRAACEGAFVARLGGDEFTIICADGAQPSSAVALAESVLHALDGEIEVFGQTFRSGMSIGVAVYPTDGADISVLLANADAALYRAKAESRGSVRFFEPEMDKRLRERRALQHELRSALSRRELTLHYQPQASTDGEIVGFEALVR